jgi:hypothetical protein
MHEHQRQMLNAPEAFQLVPRPAGIIAKALARTSIFD